MKNPRSRTAGKDTAHYYMRSSRLRCWVSSRPGSGFGSLFLAAFGDLPPAETPKQITNRGLEITFRPADPRCAGSGTLIIPKGSPLAGRAATLSTSPNPCCPCPRVSTLAASDEDVHTILRPHRGGGPISRLYATGEINYDLLTAFGMLTSRLHADGEHEEAERIGDVVTYTFAAGERPRPPDGSGGFERHRPSLMRGWLRDRWRPLPSFLAAPARIEVTGHTCPTEGSRSSFTFRMRTGRRDTAAPTLPWGRLPNSVTGFRSALIAPVDSFCESHLRDYGSLPVLTVLRLPLSVIARPPKNLHNVNSDFLHAAPFTWPTLRDEGFRV